MRWHFNWRIPNCVYRKANKSQKTHLKRHRAHVLQNISCKANTLQYEMHHLIYTLHMTLIMHLHFGFVCLLCICAIVSLLVTDSSLLCCLSVFTCSVMTLFSYLLWVSIGLIYASSSIVVCNSSVLKFYKHWSHLYLCVYINEC